MSESNNPYEAPQSNDLHDASPEDPQRDKAMTGRQAYNVLSDTVTGANIRVKDNVIQALVIAVCLVLGAALGALVVEERIPGALVGAFVGLLVGLFGSGIFLMIFRALMHMRGRHD
jgi:hypothetical protein